VNPFTFVRSNVGEDAMRTIVLAFASAIAILLNNALAVDPPAQPPTPVVPQVTPAPPPAAMPKEQLDHLKTAAEHLAKAGRKDEAAKLREQIAAFESGQAEALLAKKEKELDALVAEVDQLRTQTRRVPQIVLSFQVFEASRTRLEAAKIPQTQLLFPNGGDKFQPAVVHTVANAAAARECVDALRKKELLKVLAEPTLVTISGRQALFHSGGEFPVTLPGAQGNARLEFRKFGTQIEALPMLVGGGKLRVHVRAKVSEIDPAHAVKVNGSEIPGLRERAIETAAELRFGEALVLNGLAQARIETQVDTKGKAQTVSNEIITLVVITPEQVGPQEMAILPNPIGTGHGSCFPAPGAAKTAHSNPAHNMYIPVPTAAKTMPAKTRK
jgi:hypothetical protein